MRWTPLLAACLCLLLVGCNDRIQPMPCENVLKLRMGQTRAEVRALLGDPFFADEQGHVFFYGTSKRGQFVLLNLRDEMTLVFEADRLVSVAGYSMIQFPGHREEGGSGIYIKQESPDAAPRYRLGDTFDQMFHCTASRALEEAKKQFLEADAVSPTLAPSR